MLALAEILAARRLQPGVDSQLCKVLKLQRLFVYFKKCHCCFHIGCQWYFCEARSHRGLFPPRLASSRWDYCISVMLHQAVYKSQGRLGGGITVVAAEGVTAPNRCQWKKREASRTRQGAPFLTTCVSVCVRPTTTIFKKKKKSN